MKCKYCVLFITVLFCSSQSFTKELPTGEKAYKDNCQACHQLNSFTVGPSLVFINKNYGKDELNLFLKWAKNPGKKNPNTIQMPSMVHVGTQGLTDIHQYILTVTQGIKESKKRHNFTPFKNPKIKTPYVKRGFMPFSSPASVGVIINEQLGINWDTSIGRIRYAFVGNKNFFKGENKQNELKPFIYYQETTEKLWPFTQDYQYIGYKIENELPEFIYQFGNIKISEKITQGINNKSFIRQFTVSGVTAPIKLNFAHVGKAKLKSNKGQWQQQTLALSVIEAEHFSVEVIIK